MNKIGNYDLLVIDEAHHSTANTYKRLIESFPNSKILGVTATPIRTDGRGFRDLFEAIECGVAVRHLIEHGSLSKYRLFANAEQMVVKGARVSKGEYRSSDINRLNNAHKLADDVVNSYEKYAHGTKAIVFCSSIEHSLAISQGFCLSGHAAMHLDGETPAEDRAAALKRFSEGELKVLVNVGLFGEGVDIPSITTVIDANPTKSLSHWLQKCGRALRPLPGKDYAIIIDHTDNWETHGLPCDDREWSLDGVFKKPRKLFKKKNGEVVEYQEPITEINHSDIELVEITTNRPVAPLRLTPAQEAEEQVFMQKLEGILQIQKNKGYKPGWVQFRLLEIKPPLSVWQAAGKALGYKPIWAEMKYREQVTTAA